MASMYRTHYVVPLIDEDRMLLGWSVYDAQKNSVTDEIYRTRVQAEDAAVCLDARYWALRETENAAAAAEVDHG